MSIKSDLELRHYLRRDKAYVNHLLVSDTKLDIMGVYKQWTRTGSYNPDWKRNILEGKNASTNMTIDSIEAETIRPWNVSFFYDPWPYGSNSGSTSTLGDLHPYWGADTYPSTPNPSWELEAKQQATVVFLKRLHEADHKFQGGVFFGEIVPTMRMLIRPFGSLRDGIVKYVRAARRRGRNAKPKDLGKILGDTWLEYSFGWRPFMADITDASGALIDLYAKLRKHRIKATADRDFVQAPPQVSDYVNNLVYYKVTRSHTVEYSVRYYGTLTPLPNASLGLSSLDRIQKQSGFNLAAFVPTIWELIPYSFLIDYFSNVGEVLNTYSVDTSVLSWVSMVEIRQASASESWDVDHARQYEGTVGYKWGRAITPPPLTYYVLQGNGGALAYRRKNIIRWPFATLEYPGLRFELPFKRTQFANMGALLAGSRRLRG